MYIALGNDDEVLRVLTKMKNNKLFLLHRLINMNYIHRTQLNSELSTLIQPMKKSKYTVEGNIKLLKEFKRRQNFYFLKYIIKGWRELKITRISREKQIELKLHQINLKKKANFLSILKSNVNDRRRQKLNFEIKGLTQCVFDLQDEVKFEKREKQKGQRALRSNTNELKKTAKLYNKEYKKVKELELENNLIQPDEILEGIHQIANTAKNSQILMAKLQILDDNQ